MSVEYRGDVMQQARGMDREAQCIQQTGMRADTYRVFTQRGQAHLSPSESSRGWREEETRGWRVTNWPKNDILFSVRRHREKNLREIRLHSINQTVFVKQ